MAFGQQILPGIAISALLLAGACSQKEATSPEPPAPAADAVTNSAPESPVAAKAAALPRTASADGARVFFITPANGDSVSNPISIEFGIEGMSVVAAGDDQPQSGHHHLLIDTDLPTLSLPVPADANHVHFGDASTSTELSLESGQHTLRLLLGDHLHIPHNPPIMSELITITVQ